MVLDQLITRVGEYVVSNRPTRDFYAIGMAAYAAAQLRILRNPYRSAAIGLRADRLLTNLAGNCPGFVRRMNAQWVRPEFSRCLRESYLESTEARETAAKFSEFDLFHVVRMKLPRNPNSDTRQGDVLVLKPYVGPSEKGVLLVQYSPACRGFVALFDLEKLAERYRIVLEPSSWGYQDPTFFLFAGISTDVIIQSQYAPDHAYITSLGSNLVASRVGAGDWVDPELFKPDSSEKRFDLVMIANWLPIKRHQLLFSALAELRGEVARVALIGYPIQGWTIDLIMASARRWGVLERLEFFESVPAETVASVIRASRAAVMLTRREGANRGLYEAVFSDVPVIVSECNIGVNRDHINPATGKFAKDDELAATIREVLSGLQRFTPRNWALEHTGCYRSTERLGDQLESLALANGEKWTRGVFPKKNVPNGVYVDDRHRLEAAGAFDELGAFLRRWPLKPA